MPSQLTLLPNVITFARILAIPVICGLLAIADPGARALAVALYVLAAASDWVDGFLARRLDLGSPLGRMLDPIADKLLVGALLVTLAWTRDLTGLDLLPAIAILMREIFISGLREYLGPRNIVVAVTRLAKWKTTLQLLALGLVIAGPLMAGLGLAGSLALWLAGILTVWSGTQYFAAAWPHLEAEAS